MTPKAARPIDVQLASTSAETLIRLDLNNIVLQTNLLTLQKPELHAALATLNKIRQFAWNQRYRDNGLKWEKIASVKPSAGVDAIYSLRITHSGRTTVYRGGDFVRFLTVAADRDGAYDGTYGRK